MEATRSRIERLATAKISRFVIWHEIPIA